METAGLPIPQIHLQSSYGLLNYPDLPCDYVRAGISLYGVSSSPDDRTLLQPKLRPVLALKAKVVLIREISRGETVGYNRTFRAERNSRIAILPIGYGDGLPRNLSGRPWCGSALIFFPSSGASVWISSPSTHRGRRCFRRRHRHPHRQRGKQPSSRSQCGRFSGSISNELLCRLGQGCRW